MLCQQRKSRRRNYACAVDRAQRTNRSEGKIHQCLQRDTAFGTTRQLDEAIYASNHCEGSAVGPNNTNSLSLGRPIRRTRKCPKNAKGQRSSLLIIRHYQETV